MNPPDFTYKLPPDREPLALNEAGIEDLFIQKLRDLKYTDRPDIHDRAALEAGWRCRIRNATAGDQFDAPLRFNLQN
jgi:type I restriction enzyme R subunit